MNDDPAWNEPWQSPSARGRHAAGVPPFQPVPPEPGQPPDYAPYTGPAGPAQAARTNGFAIASLILGVLGVTLLGVIFGIVALSQIRRRQQRGRGLAIAGLVLSGAWTAVLAVAIVAAALASPTRSAAGHVTRSGTISIFSLRVGDCFQNPSGGGELRVRTVTVVPCATAHNAQAFARFTPSGSGYPGRAALVRQASRGCQARVPADLDQAKITSSMTLRFIFPERQSWTDGQRAVTCLVADSSADLTSSLLAAHPAG